VAPADPVLGIAEGAPAEVASGIAEAQGEVVGAWVARGLVVVRTVLAAEISRAAAGRIAMPLVVAPGDTADRLRAAAAIADRPALALVAVVEALAVEEAEAEVAVADAGNKVGLSIEMTGAQE